MKSKRIHQKTKSDIILDKLKEYAYLETFILVSIYLGIGYIVNPDNICMLNGQVSYILILLSIITLFHGFENGIFALGLIALAMWYFYPSFEYKEFLVALLMTLIFSEFHYFWTAKIKEAKVSAEYSTTKLDELSKAFYTLKISHDQLEKNYVVKPMSIRNSIEQIIRKNKEVPVDTEIDIKNEELYRNFLLLLEKSFNVKSGIILFKKYGFEDSILSQENSIASYSSDCEGYELKSIFSDYLVDEAINRKQPIYVSNKKGEPVLGKDGDSDFIAAIPSLSQNNVTSVLIIKNMSFMAFNIENLTSIAILLEYFALEISEYNILSLKDEISIITDKKFTYEYSRLKYLYEKYKVGSIVLVIRINNELQASRVYEKIIKMLRSLDMVTMIHENGFYYVVLLFPLHDKSAAIGYYNRLLNTLKEDKDKKFDYMTFNMKQTTLFNKYLREDYES